MAGFTQPPTYFFFQILAHFDFVLGGFCLFLNSRGLPIFGPKIEGCKINPLIFVLEVFARCRGKRAGQTTKELESQAVVTGRMGAWWHSEKNTFFQVENSCCGKRASVLPVW